MKDTSRSEEIENQHQKFRQTARNLEVDESSDALDKAFDKLEPQKVEKEPVPDRQNNDA